MVVVMEERTRLEGRGGSLGDGAGSVSSAGSVGGARLTVGGEYSSCGMGSTTPTI